MKEQLRLRFWIETAMSLAGGALLAVTLVTRNWIELAFRVDPDQSNGLLEYLVIGAALVVLVGSATLAGREFRRRQAIAVEA